MNILIIIFIGLLAGVSGIPWELCGLVMMVGFVVTEVIKAIIYK